MTGPAFAALGEEMVLLRRDTGERLPFLGRIRPCALESQGSGWRPERPGLVPAGTFELLAKGDAFSEQAKNWEIIWRNRRFDLLRSEPMVLEGQVEYWRCLLREKGGTGSV